MRHFLYGLFLIADAGLLLLFAAGYAARYTPPNHLWWLQLVALGLPVLSLLVIVIGIVLAITRQFNALFVVHGVAAILVLVRFFPSLAPLHTSGGSEPGMRVLTWNVKLREGRSGEVDLVRAVSSQRPDVLALQETLIRYSTDPPVLIMEPQARVLLGAGWQAARSMADPSEDGTPLPILATLEWVDPALQSWSIHYDGEERPFLSRAVLRWNGRDIAIYNVHLRSFDPEGTQHQLSQGLSGLGMLAERVRIYRRDFLIRTEEARQVRAILEGEDLPYVLCGDLNTTPHQWVYRYLSRGHQDVFAAAGGGLGGTYHSLLPLVRIDYILASTDWRILSARVLGSTASDHRALTAEIRLPL